MTSPSDDTTPNVGPAPQETAMDIGSAFNRPDNPYERPWLFRENEAIAQLQTIEKVIRRLPWLPTKERCLDDDFTRRTVRHGKLKGTIFWTVNEDSRLHQCRLFVRTLMGLQNRRYNLSLHAQAFLYYFDWCDVELSNRENIPFTAEEADKISERLQAAINALSTEITSPYFKRQVKNVDTAAKSRVTSLREWMHAAFRQAPNVLWVQLHLGYIDQPYDDLTQALNDRKAFLANRDKNPLFRCLVGYVSKLHYYPTKGLIHDMILLYDAHYLREEASLTQALKRHWESVTNHHGMVWIEGEPIHPKAPRINGIWSLDTQEDKQRLKTLIHYLSFYDTFLHYRLPPHTHTLVKSQKPGKKQAKNAKKGGGKTAGKAASKRSKTAPLKPTPFEI